MIEQENRERNPQQRNSLIHGGEMIVSNILSNQRIKEHARVFFACALMVGAPFSTVYAQQAGTGDAVVQERIQALTEAMNRVETQMQETQRELDAIRKELAALQGTGGLASEASPVQSEGVSELQEAVQSIRETQAMHGTQIATLQQSKVESASKYPLKLSGMVLMTGFVNTRQVDVAATPTIAVGGSGSTGATFQQTVLGFDGSGPNLFGASSHADLRVDFDGGEPGSGSYAGYKIALLRLRTAHADLLWSRTRLFFALDRTILNPNAPTSLTAVAVPPLAWSGNLWSWNPQFGVSYDVLPTRTGSFRVQAALMDVGDPPPLTTPTQVATYTPPATSELSRWPGAEWRFAYESSNRGLTYESANQEDGLRLGLSGFFAPHRTPVSQTKFESWAGAADFRIPVTRYMQLSGNAYHGAGLGSLGGGAYKNYVFQNVAGELYFETPDNNGGWAQWKQKPGERLEFNEAFGIDDVPAHQLRPFATSPAVSYYNLTRNRTITGNVIYSPSAYLLFSLEYSRLASSYVTSPTQTSDVIGMGAGYQF
jgi:hypothetical protein